MIAVTDALGVTIRVGDAVTVIHWGAPVRLVDTGTRSTVAAVMPSGLLRLANREVANGRSVAPGVVAVARRDGQPGHEGNRTREI